MLGEALLGLLLLTQMRFVIGAAPRLALDGMDGCSRELST